MMKTLFGARKSKMKWKKYARISEILEKLA
jgi:hypothetical protein